MHGRAFPVIVTAVSFVGRATIFSPISLTQNQFAGLSIPLSPGPPHHAAVTATAGRYPAWKVVAYRFVSYA
ncbi:MAG: hypothetical protein J6336_02250, partial [Kiritimatiellae bacterium]|nr:hypothetical protein [Kiritimatiellia bacterium]